MEKFVLKNSKTRSQKAETRFQNAKLSCPAFSLQGLGWILHKKAWNLGKIISFLEASITGYQGGLLPLTKKNLPEAHNSF